ncbi:rhodanese-like domain-containing protein [Streptomyces sp. NPDC021356]|uniref:rhodanese-like domain-containing protein n=1 Tax=Streptomyces sp. NPDC021356 TaxID=3154900 RepID=UPI0033C7DB0F
MFSYRRGESRVTTGEADRRAQDADAPAILLGVRGQDEWSAGHAPGAARAPLSGPKRRAALAGAAAQGRPPTVGRRGGHRSRRAAGPPAERGAEAVDVKDGVDAWAAAGRPVTDGHGNHGFIA